ncbi:hypothetical protein DFH94DRAFT_784107 [Russula ochroleuca]|uniref:Secreted protein n=1 Tax=Russula ochroleuca TaxID=152965 RepID=A0A9P5JVW3_9AGAM|nr:hypothetical protein DFH94DRAFT_784107 [Russula ochroleuca]
MRRMMLTSAISIRLLVVCIFLCTTSNVMTIAHCPYKVPHSESVIITSYDPPLRALTVNPSRRHAHFPSQS